MHAYYGHLSTIPTHNFLKKHGRPFIISRSNSVGTGRFAGHWTGDNVADWDFLRLTISGNFLFQIFGTQMVGADVCGFHSKTYINFRKHKRESLFSMDASRFSVPFRKIAQRELIFCPVALHFGRHRQRHIILCVERPILFAKTDLH